MRVLVINRSRAFAEALTRLLGAAGVAAHHASFDDIAAALAQFSPSLVVVESEAGAEDVAAAAEEVRRVGESRLLLLAREATPACERLAHQIGAVGWITCHASANALLQAIRRSHTTTRPTSVRLANTSRNGTPTSPEAAVLERLTTREREVLRQVMAGRRNHDLARSLGISPNTARTHVQNILGKVGARTRFEAASLARRAGLEPPATLAHSGGNV